jgi:hypothetical protein
MSTNVLDVGKNLFLLLLFVDCTWAPVPRCSPFILINKVPDSISLLSDFNPYFPVPPCEYGGPLRALRAGDYEAVFGPSEDNIPFFPGNLARHNLLEGIFLLKTALPRIRGYMKGEEELKVDWDILTEGYSHHTAEPRTTQFGHDTQRRPELIDDPKLFEEYVGSLLHDLKEGGDTEPIRVTPIGQIRDKYKEHSHSRVRRAVAKILDYRRKK